MTKEEKEENTVEDIIEDLSYSWATPEAESFHHHLRNNEHELARKMLTKAGLKKKEVALVMDYFTAQISEKYTFVELSKAQIQDLNDNDRIMVSHGGNILSALVQKDESFTRRKEPCFYSSSDGLIPLDNATQVWKVVTQV